MHVRFERSEGILERIPEEKLPNVAEQVTVGPFEWVQLTYEQLRVSPDGAVVAFLVEGDWMIVEERNPLLSHFTKEDLAQPFSDVVVY